MPIKPVHSHTTVSFFRCFLFQTNCFDLFKGVQQKRGRVDVIYYKDYLGSDDPLPLNYVKKLELGEDTEYVSSFFVKHCKSPTEFYATLSSDNSQQLHRYGLEIDADNFEASLSDDKTFQISLLSDQYLQDVMVTPYMVIMNYQTCSSP